MIGLPAVGTRIELVHTSDPHTRLEPGSRGTVTGHGRIPGVLAGKARDQRQLWVKWDDGSGLALLEGEDHWREVAE